MGFQVGDLVTLRHYPGAPIAMVVSLAALELNRIQIQYFDGSLPQMASPENWIIVSRNENR